MLYRLLILLVLLMLPNAAGAQDAAFQSWLSSFAQEAAAQGVSSVTLQRVLPTLTPDEGVVELDRRQPEGTQTLARYLRNVLPRQRLDRARRLYQENRQVLDATAKRFGVQPGVIVALWGVESGFGANMGDYEILNSLATLAYEGRRATLFRGELMHALKIIDEERVDPISMLGSWAGAMGQCQFMPSTYRRYAVDGDGDGRRDIWSNEPDVWASIANYLSAEGWKAGEKWGREVKLPKKNLSRYMGLENTKPVDVWAKLGVRQVAGKPLPKSLLQASLIQPDGPGGRAFLVYDNFRALMRWNRSTYFATSVGLLADAVTDGS